MKKQKVKSKDNAQVLFEEGVRNCAFHHEKQTEYAQYLKRGYPFITVSAEGILENKIFFQNEDSKRQFMKKHNLSTDVLFELNHLIIGEALGFPDIAIESFPIIDIEERSSIDYHGISFVCLRSDIEHCVEIMKNMLPVPKRLQTKLTRTTKSILFKTKIRHLILIKVEKECARNQKWKLKKISFKVRKILYD